MERKIYTLSNGADSSERVASGLYGWNYGEFYNCVQGSFCVFTDCRWYGAGAANAHFMRILEFYPAGAPFGPALEHDTRYDAQDDQFPQSR